MSTSQLFSHKIFMEKRIFSCKNRFFNIKAKKKHFIRKVIPKNIDFESIFCYTLS